MRIKVTPCEFCELIKRTQVGMVRKSRASGFAAMNLLESGGFSIWQQLFSIDLRKAFMAMTHFGQTKPVYLAFDFLLLLVFNHVTT